MSSPGAEFSPERYRGYLFVIVRQRWTAALQTCCEPWDVVHMALVEAVRSRPQFRGDTAEEFRGWLCKILTNTIKDQEAYLRRQKRDYRREQSIEAEVEQSSSALGRLADAGPSPSSAAAKEENLVRLADALAQLSDRQFTAISLHHLDGLTLAETAERLNRSTASVAGLLRRGLAELKRLMTGGGES